MEKHCNKKLSGQTNTKYNTNNFILHRMKNNKTLSTSYFSMVNMYKKHK